MTTDVEATDETTLNVPSVDRVRYEKNFIKIAVCELRFPTLLELETKPPSSFQSRIRKSYPFYEPQLVEAGSEREQRYLFRSKEKDWTVSVKSSAIALETSKYRDFEDFRERFVVILDNARPMIDSDFFTRVGLRYVNWIPILDGNLDGWVRAELGAPSTRGPLGQADKFYSLRQGKMASGKYTLRQSLLREGDDNVALPNPTYVLDVDYSTEDVLFNDVLEQVTSFNATNFNLFNWCLGEKARAALGKGRPK
jgi:uncharacterized protein (TIGR04255 family)